MDKGERVLKGNITRILVDDNVELYRVISEPGDHTRYDYFINRQTYSVFLFMACKNTFMYPYKLTLEQLDLLDNGETLSSYAHEIGVNPFTIIECLMTMRDIMEGDK